MPTSQRSIAVDLVGDQAPEHTGIGRYVKQLSAALQEIAVDVEVRRFRYLPGAHHRSVLRVLPIGIDGRRPGAVVHIPQSLGASVLLTRRIHPCVVTVHDLGALYCPEDQPLFGRVNRALYDLSLRGMRRADRIVVVSEFTRDHVIRAGFNPDRISVVHEGVDTDRFWPRRNARAFLAQRYGVHPPADCPIVLYVGNEQPRKNLGTLVRALATLRDLGIEFHWVKAGRPAYLPGRKALTDMISKDNLESRVTVVNDVPDHDLPYFYSAADVYVQPSVWEGFGLPVLEAMACGTPVVSSNAGSLPEVCGDAARLVDPRESGSFADAIATVFSDAAARGRMQLLNRNRVSELSWQAAAVKMRTVYEAVTA